MLLSCDEKGFTHRCGSTHEGTTCGKVQQGTHDQIIKLEYKGQTVLRFQACEQHSGHAPGAPCGLYYGCIRHGETFNPNLTAADETSTTRTEESRASAVAVRKLYQVHGLPVKP